MKRIVSYSFFRNDHSAYEKPECGEAQGKVFVNYLRLIVRAHHCIWPSWTLRFAHDDRVQEFPYWKAMVAMKRAGLLELVDFGPSRTLCGVGGMLERLRPAWEEDVEYVACRDVDSIPLPRDRRAVEEFIRYGEDRAVHCSHDNKAHSGLMGGTITVRAKPFRELIHCMSMEQFISRGPDIDFNIHGADQHLLNRHWVLMREKILIHDLHHPVGDMPGCDIKLSIDAPMPSDIDPRVAEIGDSFSGTIGGCCDVEVPFKFYDGLDLPVIRKIQECERSVL